MADTLPINFPLPSESAVASYDWIDITDGTGYKTFYAAACATSAATLYFLTKNPIDSGPIYLTVAGAGNTEQDFDSLFNRPATIEGEAILSMTIGKSAGAASTGYVDVYFIRVDTAAAEHAIANIRTETVSQNAAGPNYARITTKLTIPQTHFAIGEKLRITLKLTTAGAATNYYLYIDPSARASFTDDNGFAASSDLPIYVPFKVEL